LMKYLLIISDPIIASLFDYRGQKHETIPEYAFGLVDKSVETSVEFLTNDPSAYAEVMDAIHKEKFSQFHLNVPIWNLGGT